MSSLNYRTFYLVFFYGSHLYLFYFLLFSQFFVYPISTLPNLELTSPLSYFFFVIEFCMTDFSKGLITLCSLLSKFLRTPCFCFGVICIPIVSFRQKKKNFFFWLSFIIFVGLLFQIMEVSQLLFSLSTEQHDLGMTEVIPTVIQIPQLPLWVLVVYSVSQMTLECPVRYSLSDLFF